MNALKHYMKRTGKTQAELARFFSVSETLISYYLSGKRKISIKMAVRWARLTGIPVRELLSNETRLLLGEINESAPVQQGK